MILSLTRVVFDILVVLTESLKEFLLRHGHVSWMDCIISRAMSP